VAGEESYLSDWQAQDTAAFNQVDATTHYHHLQIADFLDAIHEDRDPMVTGREGRVSVEIFTAIYRSQRDGKPVKFPLQPEYDAVDFDGRLK